MIKKETISILISVVTLILTILIWDFLKITYKDQSIYGVYSTSKHHSLNDIIRVLTFVLLPVLSYIICKSLLLKKNLFFIFFFKLLRKDEIILEVKKKDNFLLFLLFTVLLLLFLEFLSIEFPLHLMDIYHEGQRASSAYKFHLDGSLWSENYVTVGIIYETILSNFAWDLFNSISIGSIRAIDLILILFFKFVLCLFCFLVANNSNFTGFYKNIYFILLSILAINLVDYNFPTSDLINLRDIVVFITLICIFKITTSQNNLLLYFLILSSMSVISLLWSLDRGIVCNILIFFLLIYFLINKEHKKNLSILFFTFTFWIIAYLYFEDEFIFFVHNSISIISEMSYIHGIIFPKPFSNDPDSSRATKNLLVLVLTIMILVNLYISKNKFPKNLKFFLFWMLLVSILSLIYVFGRSDGPHIKNIFGFSLIFLGIFLFYQIINYININFNENFKNLNLKYFIIFLTLFGFTFSLSLNAKNILNYPNRLSNFVNLSDKNFIEKDYIDLVNKSKNYLSEVKCIQLYTNDVGILYLLRTKSCTKYYFVWSVGSKKNQLELINKIEDENIIITNGKTDNWDLPLSKKLYIVDEFLRENFSETLKINHFKFLEKSN